MRKLSVTIKAIFNAKKSMTPKVAIIIPAYNKSYLTNLCVDSIFKAKTEITFKLIIIDNSSEEEDFQKLKLLTEYVTSILPDSIELVRNQTNLGFAKAINQGLRLALDNESTTHICLLNNDTIVSDYWLDDLVVNADSAFVGPVCNSVGNEQIIHVDYETYGYNGYTVKSIRNFAQKWREDHIGNTASTDMLGFFCVLGPRSLFEAVGLLDESFGLGYYEDDDYCVRIKGLGFRQLIVRQAYVHHWGSASFRDLSAQSLNKLFSGNREIFIKKHKRLPADHSTAWLKTILIEYDWLNLKQMDSTAIYKWIPKFGYKTLVGEVLKKLEVKVGLHVGPSFLRKPIVLFLNIISREHLWEDVKRISAKYFWQVIGRLFQYPIHTIRGFFVSGQFIVIFPIQNFDGRMQRPQHLAIELANAGYKVVWIDPDPEQPKSRAHAVSKRHKNLTVLKIANLDFSNFYTTTLRLNDSRVILNRILATHRRLDFSKTIAIMQSPFWSSLEFGKFKECIYDCMDAHDSFGSATLEVSAIEHQAIKAATKVVVTSTYLQERIRKDWNKESNIIRNACCPDDFEEKSNGGTLNGRKKIGYFGAVAEWFDLKMLIQVTQLLPQYDFEVIGNTMHSTVTTSFFPENLKFLGEKQYSELSFFAKQWDVAIIPFLLSDLILATNPVKLYEYFAIGLPVVSTPIPEVAHCPVEVLIGGNAIEFSDMIKKAISEDSIEKRKERQKYASEQTWAHRTEELIRVIENNK